MSQVWLDLMRSKTGEEILNIILTSKRANEDLTHALNFTNSKEIPGEDKWRLKIVLRKWVEGMDVTMEFRTFIKNNLMTAITEYNHPFIVAELLNDDNCLEIKGKIFKVWKTKIKEGLKYLADYVIDFAILSDGSVQLVELNPWANSAGSGLFNWINDKDILYGQNVDKSKE